MEVVEAVHRAVGAIAQVIHLSGYLALASVSRICHNLYLRDLLGTAGQQNACCR